MLAIYFIIQNIDQKQEKTNNNSIKLGKIRYKKYIITMESNEKLKIYIY